MLKENELKSAMIAAYEKRWTGYRREICYENMPPVRMLNAGAFLGRNSYTDPKGKVKYLRASSLVSVFGVEDTYTAIVRDYVTAKYPRGRAWTEQIAEARAGEVHPPLFCWPGLYDDCLYIDIKSCYWQLVSLVGWDVDYWPGKWMRPGKRIVDFPLSAHKAARSSLVTQFWKNHQRRWNGNEIVLKDVWGKNTLLYRLVCDVLNGYAIDILRTTDVYYVHTDGFIIPRTALPSALRIARAWGIEVAIKKEGETHIKGVGAYCIAGEPSKPYEYTASHQNWFNIPRVDTAWLRPRLAACRRRRDRGE